MLRVLDERGPLPLTQLSRAAVLLLPRITRMIRAMEDEALVTRATPDADWRKAVVTIAHAGRAVIRDHADARRAVFDRVAVAYGPEKLETLLNLLDDLQKVGMKNYPLHRH